MKAKTKEAIGRWLLVAAASASLILAVALVINPRFPYRDILVQQQILGDTIGLFGVLSAGFIAAIALLYVNKQIQTYSWRRDQALKDIETIYEPLYMDVSKVVEATENFIAIKYQSNGPNWKSINSSYLGTKLELMEKEFHGRLKTLFEDIEEYPHRNSNACIKFKDILKKVIEPYVDESVQAEERHQIVDVVASHVEFAGSLDQGFLMGKSIEEWSTLAFGQGKEELIESLRKAMRGLGYAQHIQRAIEQIEVILNKAYQEVQDDVEIIRFQEWCKALTTKATRLKKELEKRILEPQLP